MIKAIKRWWLLKKLREPMESDEFIKLINENIHLLLTLKLSITDESKVTTYYKNAEVFHHELLMFNEAVINDKDIVLNNVLHPIKVTVYDYLVNSNGKLIDKTDFLEQILLLYHESIVKMQEIKKFKSTDYTYFNTRFNTFYLQLEHMLCKDYHVR